MASVEELRTMIKCFRIHELQILLSFAGRSKIGKKQQLLDRALTLLKLKSEPLSFKIRDLYNLMYAKNNVRTHEKQDDTVNIVDDFDDLHKSELNEKQSNCIDLNSRGSEDICSGQSMQLTLNPLFRVHPEVKFKKLPFYKVLYELLKPCSLIPKDYQIQQKNTFTIYLTSQQVAAIHLSKDMFQCARQYAAQGQLRFCLLEPTTDQEDAFPAGLIVRVNNKFCSLQEFSGRKRKDVYVKDSSMPINITPLLKMKPGEPNKIEIQWNMKYGLAHVMAVYLVKKKSPEELLDKIKRRGVVSADQTRKMIKEKLNEEADGEIVTTSLRLSLMCPLGKIRLKTPCRASTCKHFQCFDAFLFLQMNEKKPTWLCPVCDNPAEYDKLIIDGYFSDILSSDKLALEVNEVEVHSDGNWSSVLIKVEQNDGADNKSLVKVEAEDDIIDVVEDTKGSVLTLPENSVLKYKSDNPDMAIFQKRKIDEIDLTVSDSDDEPLILHKHKLSLENKRNRVGDLNSSNTQKSVCVINLEDSDSLDPSDCDSSPLSFLLPTSISSNPASDTNQHFHATNLTSDKNMGDTEENILTEFTESAVYF